MGVKDDMKRNARGVERIGGQFEDMAGEHGATADENRNIQMELFRQQLGPYADKLMSLFSAGDFDESGMTPFPEIARPDFTGGIRRDYADDLAGIEAGKQSSLARADDMFEANGMARTGGRGVGLAGIVRGSNSDAADARRTMQGRLEGESRDAYADTRDLALKKFDATRMDKNNLLNLKSNMSLQGANILQGQQAQFNPLPYEGLQSSDMSNAAGSYGDAANQHLQASKVPGFWSKLGGVLGAGLGVASNAMGAGGLSSIWKRSAAPTT